MAKKNPVPSSSSALGAIKRKIKSFSDDEKALYQQALELYTGDLRALVDEIAALKAADRKPRLAVYTELKKQMKKVFKPGKGYRPPPHLQMKWVTKNLDVVIGWLKNAHKYKAGELLPPASDEVLEGLEKVMKAANGDDYELPSSFVDCARICDGMKTGVRMHYGIRLMSVAEIIETHPALIERGLGYMLPFGEDGAGNYYGLFRGDVYDINHEDDDPVAAYAGLGVFLAKAHKVKR